MAPLNLSRANVAIASSTARVEPGAVTRSGATLRELAVVAPLVLAILGGAVLAWRASLGALACKEEQSYAKSEERDANGSWDQGSSAGGLIAALAFGFEGDEPSQPQSSPVASSASCAPAGSGSSNPKSPKPSSATDADATTARAPKLFLAEGFE